MKAYINMWIKLRHFEICTVYRDLSTIVYNLRLKNILYIKYIKKYIN